VFLESWRVKMERTKRAKRNAGITPGNLNLESREHLTSLTTDLISRPFPSACLSPARMKRQNRCKIKLLSHEFPSSCTPICSSPVVLRTLFTLRRASSGPAPHSRISSQPRISMDQRPLLTQTGKTKTQHQLLAPCSEPGRACLAPRLLAALGSP
jgi:hypothetical protein